MENYKEWLGMTQSERDEVIKQWDAYEREGFKFVLMAAARLSFELECQIVDVHVATGHCGVWQILVFVPDRSVLSDDELIMTFEGFPVIYVDMQNI